jgi:dipeptidyl aminopeptidase/acylaminoacyl peptidase
MRRRGLFLASLIIASAAGGQTLDRTLAEIAAVRQFHQAAVSPDGSRVAYVEALPAPGKSAIYTASLQSASAARIRISAGDGKTSHDEHGLAWSPDGKQIAFLSDREKKGQLQLYAAPAAGGAARQLTHLTGFLQAPSWSPDGKRLAILFTENAPRSAGPLEPVTPDSGVVESKIYEQRITVLDLVTGGGSGAVHQVSPADFYIYEYDWSPDGRSFAATASRGAGDDNWWIAQLYTMSAQTGGAETGEMHAIHKPGIEQQVAVPRWAPDGKSVVFIGGIMSDEGSTGGEIYQVPVEGGGARSLTPGIKSSASHLTWPRASKQLYFIEHYDGGSAISQLDPATGGTERLWQGDETILPPFDDSGVALTADGKSAALVRSSWKQPPEVWAGRMGEWRQITHENSAHKPLWGEAKSLHWSSDGLQVQGWLLYPRDFNASRQYPMVVAIHGGPASSLKPSWPRPGFNPVLLSQQGYFVLLPNPRGSYGQGEKFTLANVKDFGGGDLRDILAGVDQALKQAPIDPKRIGVSGWSYGGFMTMWTVTQTNRFRAAVAGAGIANWKSYYGENSIDQWMLPYFGASVYDDPAVYAKSSPIDFIKQVTTPTLVLVGDRDGECPPAQSYEFWHALKTLGVKTQLVIYPNEGHQFHKPEHQKDVLARMIGWFNENLQ